METLVSALGRVAARRRGRARPGAGRSLRAAAGSWLLRPRVLLSLIALAAALGGGWLWLRGSSLVAVTRVSVVGASGPDAEQITRALQASARGMTTLDVSIGQLRTAVAPYPVVKGISVSTQFPHGMRIRVNEQVPVAAIVIAGHRTAVAGDGTLLRDVSAAASLPSIPVAVPPGGTKLTEPGARNAVALLAAAPYQLLGRITKVSWVAAHGLVAQLRDGPALYFGDSSRLSGKWSAALAVLADHGSAGAAYIDVTDPLRPAAGAGSSTGSSAASAGG
jgi:cell division protein FtsQ